MMLERFLYFRPEITELLRVAQFQPPSRRKAFKFKTFEIKDFEWDYLQTIHDILQIFRYPTKVLQGHKYETINLTIPHMSEIMKSLGQWRQKDFEFTNPYIAMGIQGAFDKLEHYYPIRNDDIQPLKTLYLATVLDPRLKLGVFVTLEFSRITIDSIEKYFHEVYSKYKGEYELELSSVHKTKRSKTNETSSQPGGNLNGAPSFSSYTSTSVDDNELLLYLREPQEDGNSSIREFCEARTNSFPVIRRMARDFLCIMAMSSPAESLFSQVKNIVTDKRNRLLPATIKLLAVLKARGVIPDEINTIRDSELAANPKEVVITPLSAHSFDDSEGSESCSEGKETCETGGFA